MEVKKSPQADLENKKNIFLEIAKQKIKFTKWLNVQSIMLILLHKKRKLFV